MQVVLDAVLDLPEQRVFFAYPLFKFFTLRRLVGRDIDQRNKPERRNSVIILNDV